MDAPKHKENKPLDIRDEDVPHFETDSELKTQGRRDLSG